MKHIIKIFLVILAFIGLVVPSLALETPAKQVLLIDLTNQKNLLEKEAHSRMYPASMTKIMTAYLMFERLKEGSLTLNETLRVSEKAWRMGGSKMFVEVNKRVSISDLLKGIIVQSGNDACIVVAEGLAGDEASFAKLMTITGEQIGMKNSQFRNASGWPDEEHYTTAYDLAILTQRIITDYPEQYTLFKEKEFTFSGIKQSNRNPLLYVDELQVDGLKTGYTEASGYGLVASAEKQGRRLLLVINGLESSKQRASEAERIMSWGFREWSSKKLYNAGSTIAEADIWLGQEKKINLMIKDNVALTLKRTQWPSVKVTAHFDNPIKAPIKAGDQVGYVEITAADEETQKIPLLAVKDIAELGFMGRLQATLNHIIWGE